MSTRSPRWPLPPWTDGQAHRLLDVVGVHQQRGPHAHGLELGAEGRLLVVVQQLDSLGNRDTRITVTSDLDEYAIAALAAAPVDSYGAARIQAAQRRLAPADGGLAGRGLGHGDELPIGALAGHELVDHGGRGGPGAGDQSGAHAVGALRRLDPRGTATHEIVGVGHDPADDGDDRPLMQDMEDVGAPEPVTSLVPTP
jgi:hypothetical protein